MSAFVDKNDLAHDLIQKINIMTDNQHRTFIIFQTIGYIILGHRIQMIGRFVQT